MQHDIRLLIVDIDGTIAGKSNQVSPTVIQALQTVQAQGIPVALATGRMYQSALRFHRTIGSQMPLIAYQGAWMQDPADNTLHHHIPLPIQYARELLEYFEQPEFQPELSVHFYIDDQLYICEMLAETHDYSSRSGVVPITVSDFRDILDREPTKILAMSQNTHLIDRALQELKGRYSAAELYLTTSIANFLEAAHPSVNKGAAVRYLAEELLHLEARQVMAIGDNCNDLEMLEYVGLGVAMGDAPEAVQAVAQWVAPTVDEDGVAVAIAKFIL
jgi:Cof subfamily protein (haloacid dehalogenase superfamily)